MMTSSFIVAQKVYYTGVKTILNFDLEQIWMCHFNCFLILSIVTIIADELKDVDWRELHDHLKLKQEAYIHAACQTEKRPLECQLREVVKRFINSQDPEPCCHTAEKIANALETLKPPDHHRAAGVLRSICTSIGG